MSLPAIPDAPQPIDWRGERVSRLVLGTVQLGMDYGIANRGGKPPYEQARAIVETAWRAGIQTFDTAQAYGESEKVLGRALADLGIAGEGQVISKLAADLDPARRGDIAASIDRSIENLGGAPLWGMMLHRPEWMERWEEGVGPALREAREAGKVRYLGVSLTDPAQAERWLDHPDIDMIQVACNAWDRRPTNAGVFTRARELDKMCFVRSVYLQGLLAIAPDQATERLPRAKQAAEAWHALARELGIPPVALAMRYALSLDAALAVGAETPEQIAETVRLAAEGPLDAATIRRIREAMDPVVDEVILNPSRWPEEGQTPLT